MNKAVLFSLLIFLTCSCQDTELAVVYKSDTLRIEQLTDNSYIHISYLDILNTGTFPCNGLIYVDRGEVLIFDTPTDVSVADELINWIQRDQGLKIKGVVVNHFHVDCLGGLPAFHAKHIPSYGSSKTIEFGRQDSVVVPNFGFEGSNEIQVGDKTVINRFFGEAHSKDNIVSYFPEDEILFGGCMVKEVGAGKGNVSHANTDEWSNTIAAVKVAYPNLQVVVPGHGKVGGVELLDYTIQKFKLAD